MVKMNVDPALKDTWSPIIEHQVKLILLPLNRELKSLEIRFFEQGESQNEKNFACETVCHDVRGKRHFVRSFHSDGTSSINYALTRIRQGVVRQINRH